MSNKVYSLMGIDLGSLTAKVALVETHPEKSYEIKYQEIVPVGSNPQKTAEILLENVKTSSTREIDYIVGTGYGRKLINFADSIITEITCHARGISYLNPEVRTLIDVGGQDSKVMRINEKGKVTDFEMNDKCSAGTGRFLEVMAKALECPLNQFGEQALKTEESANISNTCTVFAESEVISKINQGLSKNSVIAGIHEAIADKILALTTRVGIEEKVALSGGVALNIGFTTILSRKIEKEIFIPESPQLCGALGAALSSLKFI